MKKTSAILLLRARQSIPKHLDRPTSPPLSIRIEGDPQGYQLRIILADGRGPFRFPFPEKNGPGLVPPEKKSAKLIQAISRPPEPTPTNDAGKPELAKPPAKPKAGK